MYDIAIQVELREELERQASVSKDDASEVVVVRLTKHCHTTLIGATCAGPPTEADIGAGPDHRA